MTPKQQRFVEEYMIDMNGTQAAIRAGYSANSAAAIADENLRKPEIANELALRRAALTEKAEINAERVVREFYEVGTADASELIQYRIGCCPRCWAPPPEPELEEGLEVQAHGGALKRSRKAVEPEHDRRQPPNPDCPRCAGEGEGRAYIPDTRTLSPQARKLFAGVRITEKGVEIKMNDRMAALEKVGRHLGIFKDEVTLGGQVKFIIEGGPE